MSTIFAALDGGYEQFQEKFGVKIRLDTQEPKKEWQSSWTIFKVFLKSPKNQFLGKFCNLEYLE